MTNPEEAAEYTDGDASGLEAVVADRPVFELQWQLPVDLPGLPKIILQQTDGSRWNNHFTRVVEDGVARPAPGGMHSANEQLVRTIVDIVDDGDDRDSESATAETTEETEDADDSDDDRNEQPEMPDHTEQEGLDAFA